MPHQPEPDAGDPDMSAPPPPVFHAEQALLGALLLDPHRLHDITGIAADAFSTASHAALFSAISTVPPPDPAEHAKNTAWLNRVLATGRGQAPGLAAPYLYTLIQACPWPRHAPAYARMVEAEHARRRLWAAAEHLLQAIHDASLPHPAQTVLADADTLATVVEKIAARFPPRAGVLLLPPAHTPPHGADSAEAEQEEQFLLATATAHPADIETLRWLAPGDFTRRLHAGLWQCLTALAHRGDPVDPITVLWEAQQRGLLDTGSEANTVLRLLAEPVGSAEHWGKRTLQRSLLATADRTVRHIQAYASDPTNTPFQLVVAARRSLADVNAIRTRWHHATDTALRPRPEPPAHARPPTTTAARAPRQLPGIPAPGHHQRGHHST